MAYIGASPALASRIKFIYTASAGQTTISGVDNNGLTLSYSQSIIDVYVNGEQLVPNIDYTANDGSSIILSTALTLNDSVVIDAMGSFSVANTYSKAEVYTRSETYNKSEVFTKTETNSALNSKINKANDTGLGGFTSTSKTLPASGTINLTPVGGNIQSCAKTGNINFVAPVAAGVYTIIVEVHNANTSGSVTLTGFRQVDGDSFTTTLNHRFHIYITKTAGAVTAIVKALQ